MPKKPKTKQIVDTPQSVEDYVNYYNIIKDNLKNEQYKNGKLIIAISTILSSLLILFSFLYNEISETDMKYLLYTIIAYLIFSLFISLLSLFDNLYHKSDLTGVFKHLVSLKSLLGINDSDRISKDILNIPQKKDLLLRLNLYKNSNQFNKDYKKALISYILWQQYLFNIKWRIRKLSVKLFVYGIFFASWFVPFIMGIFYNTPLKNGIYHIIGVIRLLFPGYTNSSIIYRDIIYFLISLFFSLGIFILLHNKELSKKLSKKISWLLKKDTLTKIFSKKMKRYLKVIGVVILLLVFGLSCFIDNGNMNTSGGYDSFVGSWKTKDMDGIASNFTLFKDGDCSFGIYDAYWELKNEKCICVVIPYKGLRYSFNYSFSDNYTKLHLKLNYQDENDYVIYTKR